MWEKRIYGKVTLILGLCMALGVTGVEGKISSKTLESMVVPDQGILPGSRTTEMMRLDIVETDTSTADNPVDDGAATLESLVVSFRRMTGTDISELSTVALYRIGQDIDNTNFNFQRDFSFANNRLIQRLPVLSSTVRFENLNETIENTRGIFFIALNTDVTLDNNDEFALVVGDIVLTHPGAVDPVPDLKQESEIITCVDFAGDLMPVADSVRTDGTNRDYPFSPHNYPDYSYRHPDALDDLEDLEIPRVLPAECTPTAVLGLELAGVRSELYGVLLNFTSTVDGINNDRDYFIDEPSPYSIPGIFDPFVDEIVRDNDGDGLFSAGDEVLYAGINGVLDAERADYDDDGDGDIDEEKRNRFRQNTDAFSLYEVNEDRDYFVDESGDGLLTPGQDEIYRDLDGDGRYLGLNSLDVVLYKPGVTTPISGVEFYDLEKGYPLTAFSSAGDVAYADRNSNGSFDVVTDLVLRDLDGNGLVLVTPDFVVDFDGGVSTERGSINFQEIEFGQIGLVVTSSDNVYADSLTTPSIVWRDRSPYNQFPDSNDQLLLAPAGIKLSTEPLDYVNVATADPRTWYYHDRDDDLEFEGGEDLYINRVAAQTRFNDQSEAETILFIPAGAVALADGEALLPAAGESRLVYYDADGNGEYDELETIVFEAFPGGTYSIDGEGVIEGSVAGFSLDAYPAGVAYDTVAEALIDEDHGYTVLHPLVDEDLQNRIAWFDDNGNGVFDITDLDGDGDFFPINEDLNFNGVLDPPIDNNNDGDYDDEDDYNEDLNGDGNLDRGIGGDEIYIDYDGDGEFDPHVGDQLQTVTELFYAGDNPVVQLRASQAYPQFLEIDEDGDGERGGATMDSRFGIILGLFPAEEPFISGIAIPVADGVDNDGDGEIDEGINEDRGDSAFDALTVYQNRDTDRFNDFIVSDIERIQIYKDNPENRNGVFDIDEDLPVSRHDPKEVSWSWVDITPPVYTAYVAVAVSSGDEESDRELRQLPVTDNATYDYFVVIHTDGDDDGDEFEDFEGAEMYDGLGLRPGDDFQVSLARNGILTDGGLPNAWEVTKPIEGILHMDDMIGFVSSSVQADDDGNSFVGNPYCDATSSPIAVLGIDLANSPVPRPDGSYENDVLEQVRVHLQNVAFDEYTGAAGEGLFDIDVDGSTVTLPDLQPLADDSTGGLGIYRDDDTPEGDGQDDDGDGLIDEELLNGIDDDLDGKIDEDVGDDDPAGINGVFDPYDDPLPLRNDTGSPLSYRLATGTTDTAFVDLNLISGAVAAPDDASNFSRGYDYYVVLRTSKTVDYRDTWRVYVKDQDVRFRSGASAMNTGVDTDSIAANVPVFLSDLTQPEPGDQVQTIYADSEPTAVIGVNLYDRNLTDAGLPTSLENIVVTFDNVGSDQDFTPSDLLPVSTVEDLNGNGVFDTGEFDWNGDGVANSGRDSGVTLYRDSTDPAGKPGVFDDTDELVYLDGDETFGNITGFPNTVQLYLDRWGDQDGIPYERIPADDEGDNEGADYFVVIRTSSALSNGDDFQVRVSPVVANEIVEWPIHFLPKETNGLFQYTFSYEAIQTQVIRGNTQTDTVLTNMVSIGQRIEADSDPTAVLSINANDSGNEPPRRLNQVKVRIYPGEADDASDDLASGFDTGDLNPFSNTVNSGLAVYRDVDGEGRNGQFDPGVDVRLNQTISSYELVTDTTGNLLYVDAEINLSPGADLPDNELGENVGADFFVVVRTSRMISLSDFFSVRVPKNGLFFESGDSFGNREETTELLNSNVPTFFSDRTNVYDRRVGTNSPPQVGIALNMNSGTRSAPDQSNESIVSLIVQFNRENDSTFTNIDIAALSASDTGSGVALYRDGSAEGSEGNGRFNVDEDVFIPLLNQPVISGENEVTLVFDRSGDPTAIPAGDEDDDFGADFFVVFRTSGSITRDSEFSITVKDIRFEARNSQLSFTTGVVTGGDVNQTPQIELISPVLGDRASSEPFAVRWEDADDGEAWIDFYYMDNSKFLAQGIATVTDILSIKQEDLTPLQSESGAQALDISAGDDANQFDWDVTQVAIGDKRVIAIITDDRQAQSGAFSPGALTITNELPSIAFLQPNGVADTVVRGTPFVLSWQDDDPENNARIDLLLQPEDGSDRIELPGGRNLAEDPDGEADTYSVETTNLAAGVYYPVARITDGVDRDGTIPIVEVVSSYPFIVLENASPQLTLLTPDATQSLEVFGGELFEIRWTDQDNDSNAVISLYYDHDAFVPSDATPIVQSNEVAGTIIYSTGIPEGTGIESATDAEDGPDSFLWDVSEIPAGKYYLFARIDDGVNPPVDRYSPSFVIIDKKPTFQFVEPDGVDDRVVQGQPFVVTWLADDPDSEASIKIYLDTDRDPDNGRGELVSLVDKYDNNGTGVDSMSISTALLDVVLAETPLYPLALVVDGNNDPLLIHAQYPITIVPNEAPSIDFTRPSEADAAEIQNGDVFRIEWTDQDPDFSASAPEVTLELYYNTSPSGLNGVLLKGTYESMQGVEYDSQSVPLADDNNAFEWDISDVTAGTYYIYAILRDGLDRSVPIFQYGSYPITIDKVAEFSFLEPDGIADSRVAGASYELVWVDDDPDSDATIDFYLATTPPAIVGDGPPLDPASLGTLIGSGIQEDDPADRLEFSTAGLGPSGRNGVNSIAYYPVAVVQDENNPAQVFVADSAMTVIRNVSPAIRLLTPPVTGAVVFDDTFEIRWIDANSDNASGDPAYVNLFYDTDDRELNGVRINAEPIPQQDDADSYTWNVAASGIEPGTYYLYATIEDTARRIHFDYGDGPLIIPESGTLFFYGLHLMDQDGQVLSFDTSAERTFNVDFGFSDAINVEPSQDGTLLLGVDTAGEVRVASGGIVLSQAEQEALGIERKIAALPDLPWGDRQILDLEVDISGEGYYLLDSHGELYASGLVPNPLITPGTEGLFGFDIARDFEITRSARGGYILTGDGGVVALGDAPVISTPFFGWDIARDLEVVSGGFYLLDGMGGVYAVGEGVPSFSSPYFGYDTARDLVAIDGGGYFILFDGGKIAVGGDRVNLPSVATTTPVYDTGVEGVTDLALSGDLLAFFSEDLILQSVNRFVAAVRAEDSSAVGQELSTYYNDGTYTSKTAKISRFETFFEDSGTDTSAFGLEAVAVEITEGQPAIVTATSLLITSVTSTTTVSSELERDALPEYSEIDGPDGGVEYVSTRNLLTPVMTFSLESDQDVTFKRTGEAELFSLFLDLQPGEFQNWEAVKNFSLGEVQEKTFHLKGGQDYEYRVIVVDMSNEDSAILQPLGISFSYHSVSEEVEQLDVLFEYEQEAPGAWKITAVNLPPE